LSATAFLKKQNRNYYTVFLYVFFNFADIAQGKAVISSLETVFAGFYFLSVMPDACPRSL